MMSNPPEEVDPVDILKTLKQRRGTAKGVITKLMISVEKLKEETTDPSEIQKKMIDFEAAVQKYKFAHLEYHIKLNEQYDIEESMQYDLEMCSQIGEFRDHIDGWIDSFKKNSDETEVKDTYSVVSHHSRRSRSSKSSRSSASTTQSVKEARIRASAERAALEAEAKSLHAKQRLEQEAFEILQQKQNEMEKLKLDIEQRRHELDIQAKLSRASAIENSYVQVMSEREKETVHMPFTQHSTPEDEKQEKENKNPRSILTHSSQERARPPRLSWDPSVVMTERVNNHEQKSPKPDIGDFVSQLLSETRIQQQSLVEAIQLPKAELIVFDGDPLNYWSFIRSFENTVDHDTVSDSAKLIRLIQYCSGRAKTLLQCCLVKEPAEGYKLAKKLLRERFGNPSDISQAWINKIIDRDRVTGSESLLDFADDLRCCNETLATMGYLYEIENKRTLLMIIEKLPNYLQTRWLRKNHEIKYVQTRSLGLNDVIKFVSVAAEEATDPVFGKLVKKDTDQRKDKQFKDNKERKSTFFSNASNPRAQNEKSSVSFSQTKSNKPTHNYVCPSCNQSHYLNQCATFRAMSVKDRLKFVQSKKLCVNCFQPNHYGRDCPRTWTCNVEGCGQKHNRWLHLPKSVNDVNATQQPNESTERNMAAGSSSNQTTNEPNNPPTDPSATNDSTVMTCGFTWTGVGKVALPIVPVCVRPLGTTTPSIHTYALLDSGSTQSFCSQELVDQLQVSGQPETIKLTTLDKRKVIENTLSVSLEVQNIKGKQIFPMPNVLTRPNLNVGIDHYVTEEELSKWPHLRELKIPDVNASGVHLLIGQDVPDVMIPLDVKTGGPGEPYATRTALGWTLNGPVDAGKQTDCDSYFIKADDDLQRQVEKFWKLDDMSFTDKSGMSISDSKTISIWKKSINKDGAHYQMDIPFKRRPLGLPDNRVMAEHRLSLLGKRLSKNDQLKTKYQDGVKDLLSKGYAERVPEDQIHANNGNVWYLPHHPVINPHKPDKLRIVFDCSAHYHGTSLNDNIYQGPDLTNKLIGVLLCFREESIAFMADIEGMFHQVKVNGPDRDVLRFLWWEDGDMQKQVVTYRMTVHLFGGIWSPSCANFALKRTAQDNQDKFDAQTVCTVDKNFYVDDCLKSVSTETEAIQLSTQLCQLLFCGGFHLTKWISNSRLVMKSVPEKEWAKCVASLDLDCDMLPSERALGVLWDVENDVFSFDVNAKEKPMTKRGLLSVASSIYDPLGFVCPYVLNAKILFQDLCRLKVEWDEEIPDNIEKQWKRWLEDLSIISRFSVPRCLKPETQSLINTAQLHHFSDASELGYGAVSYLRLNHHANSVHCSLVMAKAKLAPLKTITIPRLELAAAVESVKLDQCIKHNLNIPLIESVFWTDSMIVLQYLHNEDKRFKTFVANRVSQIHEQSSPDQWRHVDSQSNPADDVSRGMSAEELVTSERWINGPPFLWKEESEWPCQPEIKKLEMDNTAEIKQETSVYQTNVTTDSTVDDLLSKYSSWYKLKKAVAWILRAKAILMRKAKLKKDIVCDKSIQTIEPLTLCELQKAEEAVILYVQRKVFTAAYLQDKSISKLSPVKQGNGILCVGGRLTNSSIPNDAKHPILMPKDHHVTNLIIQQYHAVSAHAGVERVLGDIRQKYWIIKGRVTVKQLLHKCVKCRKLKAPAETQKMADLPPDRVTPSDAPFCKIGVDYFGPFKVKRCRSEVKRYGCLFTCLTTRAIHIEVSHSLETESFINALQRFIARRGPPTEIRSDNGTNFVGSKRELSRALKDWNQHQITDYLLQKEIKWSFNTPTASHMGGVWERQIRTVRSILMSLLDQQVLDDEGLVTLMCVVEGIVNGRPITKLSDDPSDPLPLTPNHLLLLRSGSVLPPGYFVQQDIYRRRWRQVQYLADIFWKRWIKEYLPTLQERQKWIIDKRNLEIGDLILLCNENMPRNQWPLGLVTNTYPGKDGKVRSVQVKTKTGLYDRPINKMCLLEAQVVNVT